MPFNFDTPIPTFEAPPFDAEEHFAATDPGPLLPAEDINPNWVTGWGNHANDWQNGAWHPQLTPAHPENDYPSPPPSPTLPPLSPFDLVRHYIFDPSHSDYINIRRLKTLNPHPQLTTLVLRRTFFTPEYATPILQALHILLDLPYVPWIGRRIRHAGTPHRHFVAYDEDPICVCSCCRYCPVH